MRPRQWVRKQQPTVKVKLWLLRLVQHMDLGRWYPVPPWCTRCNNPPVKSQCTSFVMFTEKVQCVLAVHGLEDAVIFSSFCCCMHCDDCFDHLTVIFHLTLYILLTVCSTITPDLRFGTFWDCCNVIFCYAYPIKALNFVEWSDIWTGMSIILVVHSLRLALRYSFLSMHPGNVVKEVMYNFFGSFLN